MKKDETKNREYHRMYYQKHKEQARERARQAYHRKKMLAQSLPTIPTRSLNTNFGSIRKVEIDGQTWFVAIDVANILGASRTHELIRVCEKDEVNKIYLNRFSQTNSRKLHHQYAGTAKNPYENAHRAGRKFQTVATAKNRRFSSESNYQSTAPATKQNADV